MILPGIILVPMSPGEETLLVNTVRFETEPFLIDGAYYLAIRGLGGTANVPGDVERIGPKLARGQYTKYTYPKEQT